VSDVTRAVIFDSPLVIGFEGTQALIERLNRSQDSYPPYNVEVMGPTALRITIAVAGFGREQLKIELRGRSLSVFASKEAVEAPQAPRDYLHRGIALRSFVRSFVLGDELEVMDAVLAYGQLQIDLKRPEANDRVVTIPIRAG
jgi:HSP20 family molecular chaperone IbpA